MVSKLQSIAKAYVFAVLSQKKKEAVFQSDREKEKKKKQRKEEEIRQMRKGDES